MVVYRCDYCNYTTSIKTHFNAKNIEKFRSDFKYVTNFLKKNSQKNDLLLTNDVHTQIWWILSERNYFYFPYVFFVALNDNMIEKQLINSFKYFFCHEFVG